MGEGGRGRAAAESAERAEGEWLMALAEGVAAREHIAGVKLVVHFDNEVVVVLSIVSRRWQRAAITHGKEREDFVGRRGGRCWRDARGQTSCGDVGGRGHLEIEIGANAFALAFVGAEEKSAAFNNRAA